MYSIHFTYIYGHIAYYIEIVLSFSQTNFTVQPLNYNFDNK